ncbi:MAG: DUF2076 domain-containing protein, partial [Sphingomonadaceae bacterium]|nr:DUF2076 domain-containing protein [Sphingomonadaceae bacterium]
MTPDERTLLTAFLRDLAAPQGVAKDAEADAMIRDALARNPDAAYLLVQHAIVADQALHAAQARIAELEAQARPASPGFLPTRPSPWNDPAVPPSPTYGYSQSYGQAYAPPPPEARPSIFGGGGGLGSFLRSAGTTAAGVAGGELLFSGLSDLFGGHHGGQGFGGFDGPREEVVVNNFYDDGDRGGGN